MLSGQIKSLADLPEDDYRRQYPRFAPENFDANIRLVERVKELAEKRSVSPAQYAINWTRSLSRKLGFPQIIPIPGSTRDSRVRENALQFDLSEQEMSAIDTVLARFTVAGTRYPDFIPTDG
jgi:pyridoxine 4-dehydrogenase